MLYTRFSTIILSFFVLLIISCSGEKDLVQLSSFTHKDPKIDFADSWVQLRKSNTEPIIRVYSEAKSQKSADELSAIFIGEIKNFS